VGPFPSHPIPCSMRVENDYVWTQFIDNQIIPVGMKK
jgi:hypothetical protein